MYITATCLPQIILHYMNAAMPHKLYAAYHCIPVVAIAIGA
uniref:Uncharacterized protein n=1 Tax=Anguilla anguilla TaxID=7936 RepID=A0A0E9QVH9_ANGAN